MQINLIYLHNYLNNKIFPKTPYQINIYLLNDNIINVSLEGVSTFYDNQRFCKILKDNNAILTCENSVYEILSKHIINQWFACSGKKVNPEIKTSQGDFI